MRSETPHHTRGKRLRPLCRYMLQPLRLLSFLLIGMVLLCGSAGCGRKGPLKPLKKEAPSCPFTQTGRAH
jgi:predicted small lipoprotein YifL